MEAVAASRTAAAVEVVVVVVEVVVEATVRRNGALLPQATIAWNRSFLRHLIDRSRECSQS